MKPVNNRLLVAILMLTIVIDVMGVGLVFPVIPEIMMSKQSPFFGVNTADSLRNFYYGLSMAVWPLGIFIGSAIIGRLSDKYGRKLMIIVSLAGTIVAYLLSVSALALGSLSIFMLSRFICGFFGGSFSIAQAVILDISNENNRVKNLSLITLSASIGFVFGPLITTAVGLLSQTEYQAITLPFWFGAIFSMVNLLSVFLFLSETYANRIKEQKLKLISLVFSFKVMFSDKRVKILALAFLMLQIGWGYYAQGLPLVLAQAFQFEPASIGFVFVIMSLGFAFSTLYFQNVVLKRLNNHLAMLLSGIIIAVLIALCTFFLSQSSMIISAFIGALLEIIFYTALLSVIASKVGSHEQGAIMGGTTSVFGIAWAINAFTLGLFTTFYLLLPLYLAAVSILIAGLVVKLDK
ncbi:MFS transporter [Cysteiniphilum sp. QT6929]|uniref:MFS transporter n=1 Tax=Cysteiniphilum sp. QT6929 TaxID=2975055 RepID=UPI0024B37637|nr:MFS transporter [Cysteiniphilum sp. QT6929]WHN64814.1 MFS transporter [Cysteiniphilum sp. QT6929]